MPPKLSDKLLLFMKQLQEPVVYTVWLYIHNMHACVPAKTLHPSIKHGKPATFKMVVKKYVGKTTNWQYPAAIFWFKRNTQLHLKSYL
jgi:hypothetical protein